MKASRARWLLIGSGLLLLFAAAVAVLVRLLPRPLTPADYFVVGSAATLLVLLVLFLALLGMWLASGKGRRGRS